MGEEWINNDKTISPIERVRMARNPQRPNILDYVNNIFTDSFELKGDRLSKEDESIFKIILFLPLIFFGFIKNIIDHFSGENSVQRKSITLKKEEINRINIEKNIVIPNNGYIKNKTINETIKSKSSNVNLTHEQIAKYLGTAREVVSRMLKYFEKEGYVTLFRGGITINNKKELQTILK